MDFKTFFFRGGLLCYHFIVLSQQLSGAAVVLRWSGFPSSLGGLAHRSGESFQKETELEVKDE